MMGGLAYYPYLADELLEKTKFNEKEERRPVSEIEALCVAPEKFEDGAPHRKRPTLARA